MRLKKSFQVLTIYFILFYVPPSFALEKQDPEAMHEETLMQMRLQGLLSPDYVMNRGSSGTSWVPDSSPMHSLQFQPGQWDVMLHANAFLRYTDQNAFEGAKRDGKNVNALNWAMLMARHSLGEGQIAFRGMLSLEPLTVGGGGYPLFCRQERHGRGKGS